MKIHKNDEYVRFENFKRKITSPFMTYADSEKILLPDDNRK